MNVQFQQQLEVLINSIKEHPAKDMEDMALQSVLLFTLGACKSHGIIDLMAHTAIFGTEHLQKLCQRKQEREN